MVHGDICTRHGQRIGDAALNATSGETCRFPGGAQLLRRGTVILGNGFELRIKIYGLLDAMFQDLDAAYSSDGSRDSLNHFDEVLTDFLGRIIRRFQGAFRILRRLLDGPVALDDVIGVAAEE